MAWVLFSSTLSLLTNPLPSSLALGIPLSSDLPPASPTFLLANCSGMKLSLYPDGPSSVPQTTMLIFVPLYLCPYCSPPPPRIPSPLLSVCPDPATKITPLLNLDHPDQRLANSFGKGPDGKYFRQTILSLSQQLISAIIGRKHPKTRCKLKGLAMFQKYFVYKHRW